MSLYYFNSFQDNSCTMMKVFAALCLLSIVISTWSLPVSLNDVKDNLKQCGVKVTKESLDCLKEMASSTAVEGIDIESVAWALGYCGVSWNENSLKCLSKWIPNIEY